MKRMIMKERKALFMALAAGVIVSAMSCDAATQYIILNMSGQSKPAEVFARISKEFPTSSTNRVRVGIAGIFSYLNKPREKTAEDLRRFTRLALETDTPIVIQLDGENWWAGRPDLWNWWDPKRPGYNPENRLNVEWAGWSPDDALKIAWRNWGRQIRVLPPPNLMSERYREACRQELKALVPVILNWWRVLPREKRELLVGIKVGWESSIGVNAWYYPNGNSLLDKPEKDDPTTGLNHARLPSRGVQTIGYAAAKTSGVRTSGALTEADQAEIVRRHLEWMCRELIRMGVPSDRLFTHTAGWKAGEMLYQSAVNADSCPGWSFYQYAADPQKDSGVQAALKTSRARYWAAVEWLYMGSAKEEPWRQALQTTLAQPRCRFLTIYNWEGIRDSKEILRAIKKTAGVK